MSTISRDQIDLGWFRHHAVDEILPRWYASVTPQGLFLSHFGPQWQPLNKGYGTLVSQSRLIYNFAQGYALTGDKRYLDAVESGANFLVKNFRDREHGGWFWSCNLNGEVLDMAKNSYGHAFVIFGLSHAAQATGSAEFRQAALDTWDVFQTRFRDKHGGFALLTSRDFSQVEDVRSQNPVMHLFEALLALSDVKGAEHIRQAAKSVGDFVLTRLVRAGDRRLPEVYSSDWQELPGNPQGLRGGGITSRDGRLDIGHAFEWAFLMDSAAERGVDPAYADRAKEFLQYGMELGYDWQEGGIYSPTSPEGKLYSKRKGWWEQTETTRTLLRFVFRRRDDAYLAPLAQQIAYIRANFVDPQHGGWYSFREPGDNPATQDKGHEWKLDYHVIGMCMEAIRIQDAQKRAA